MSAAAVTAIVLFLFFLTGVATGILVVIAMSARRAHKKADRPDPPPGTPRVGWPYLNEPDSDDDEPDEPPWRQARDAD